MITSDLHVDAPKEGIRFDTLKTDGSDLSAFARYGQSKLAMILWTRKSAQLYPELNFTTIHPGVVQTNLTAGATDSPFVLRVAMKVARPLLTGVEKGVRNQLWASVSKDAKSGEYYTPVGIAGKGSALSKNDELAESLWEWTERELEIFNL
jgi:retinol dehydrogenase 12